MKKIFIVLACMLLLTTITGCTQQDIIMLSVANPDAVIPIAITENGFSLKADKVQINNYRLGTTAEAYYFVTNDTDKTISPDIYLDIGMNPDKFSQIEGQGYKYPPKDFEKYILIEEIDPIPPGELRIYIVSFNVPKKTKVPDKWAFRTILAGNNGGQNQVASWMWWIVNMR